VVADRGSLYSEPLGQLLDLCSSQPSFHQLSYLIRAQMPWPLVTAPLRFGQGSDLTEPLHTWTILFLILSPQGDHI
jgi:hypothetical protein